MYTRSSFGSYYPSNSVIHRLNPVIKIINFLLTIILLLLTNSLIINGFLFIFVFIMIVLSKVPIKYYFESFWYLRFVYLLVAIICWYFKVDVINLLIYIMKLIVITEYLNIISYTTSSSENIYGIEKFLSVFNFLYLPINKFASKINSMFRYFPIYIENKNQILKSSYSRGVKNNKNMFFKVRRLTKRNINEIKNASMLRLYDVKEYRTNYRTNKIGFNDIIFLLFNILLVFVYLTEEGII